MEENDIEAFFRNSLPEPTTEATVEPTPEVGASPATEPEAETIPQPETTMVPLAALKKEREAKRDRDAEIDELREQVARLTAAQAPAPEPTPTAPSNIPDPYDDPTGYHAFVQHQIAAQTQHAIALNNLAHSRARAVEKYGQAVIDEVADWAGSMADADPAFEQKLFAQPDPAQWVIDEKRRHDLTQQILADPDAWAAHRMAELGQATVAPAPVIATPSKKPAGPASLVTAKSANTEVSIKQQQEDVFDSLFKK